MANATDGEWMTSGHFEPVKGPVAVIGAGSIGTAFALVFARAGCPVRVQDPDRERLNGARATVSARLADLAAFALLDEPAETILSRVETRAELADCVEGCGYVQECAPEQLELKRGLFGILDATVSADAILASSSSFIPASEWAGHLPGRHRCLVVHPGNPPYLIPVAEIVPAPFTAPDVVTAAWDLLAGIGMSPILVRREVEGFVYNRLQGAVLREAYCLVRDGVASADDIDRIVRDGLGLRWSVVGPFETADLNTRGGIEAHAARMGPSYRRMGAERGQDDPWTADLVAAVASERRAALPLDAWDDRVAWRDRALMGLLQHRRSAAP